MPPELALDADAEAGDRDGGHLQVRRRRTPAALRPTIMARLSTRAARLVSREVTTVDPFFMVRAVRHGQPHRQLRGDVDIGQAGHAEPPEQVAGARVTPRRSRS